MGNEKKYKIGLYAILVISLIITLTILFFQTNIFYKQSGSDFTQKIYLDKIVEGQVGGGYMILRRSDETPSFLESVKFDNDEIIQYFTISENQKVTKEVKIVLPEGMTPGKYSFSVEININDKTYNVDYEYNIR